MQFECGTVAASEWKAAGLPGEAIYFALSGAVNISAGEGELRLEAGDALHFRAHLEHSYANAGKTPAVFVSASQPRCFH